MNNIQLHDTVKFDERQYPDETGQLYKVIELNGDRCILEDILSHYAIHPTSIAKVSELILVENNGHE